MSPYRSTREPQLIRDEIRRAWHESPAKVIGATVATILAPFIIWAMYTILVETLYALGFPRT